MVVHRKAARIPGSKAREKARVKEQAKAKKREKNLVKLENLEENKDGDTLSSCISISSDSEMEEYEVRQIENLMEEFKNYIISYYKEQYNAAKWKEGSLDQINVVRGVLKHKSAVTLIIK